jgi:hypothetical protein
MINSLNNPVMKFGVIESCNSLLDQKIFKLKSLVRHKTPPSFKQKSPPHGGFFNGPF